MDYRPLRYQIDDQTAARLSANGIPPHIVRAARKTLNNSVRTFDRYLERMNNRHLAWAIRQAAIVVDNTLIDRWQWQIREAETNGDTCFECFVIPGFAWVRFRFPEGTLYPCLPMRDPHYGLVYVLQGECYATAPEILLALQAGAQIEALTSVEFAVVNQDDLPIRPLLPYLSRLIAERARYKPGKAEASAIMETLIKEVINSGYGKTAQGVNPRKVVRIEDGESELLGPSKITESIMASLTTGLARAALSAFFLAIERFNDGKPADKQITLISGTTDGLLVGLPAPPNYTVVGDYYTSPSYQELAAGEVPKFIKTPAPRVADVLGRFGCGELLEILDEYLPIRQMRASRIALTGDSTFLEIKHFADEIFSYKTRGQTGMLSTQHCSFIAKFGQRTPFSDIIADPEVRKAVMSAVGVIKNTIEAQWVETMANTDGGKIPEYNFYTLHSFKEILRGDALDLTQKITPRKFNGDYDCKRRFDRVADASGRKHISPATKPFETLAQMKKVRGISQAIRKTGLMATPERIQERITQQARATRMRGGTPVSLTRLVLRGVLQGAIPITLPLADYSDLATGLNTLWEELELTRTDPKIWTKTDLKNAKRGLWETGLIHESLPLLDLLSRLCVLVGANLEEAKPLIFASNRSLGEDIALIEEVAKAILLAPRQGIEPFATLYVEGLLPTRQRVLDAFYPHLSEARLAQLVASTFVSGQRPGSDRPRVRRLLSRLGITGEVAEACSRVLSPIHKPQIQDRKTPKNPKCTELFVQALMQPDVVPFASDRGRVLQHFSEYGVTPSLLTSLGQRKFLPRVLSASAANRLQIRQMAKRLGLDPQPFFHALLNR